MLQLVDQNSLDQLEHEDRLRKRVFAANYALGTPLIKSMRAAGFEKPLKQTAFKLLEDAFVREEIERNFKILQSSLLQGRELVIAQLDDAIEKAHNLDEMPSVIAGIVAKAKILGLLSQDQSKNMPNKIHVEWGGENQETIYEKSNPLIHGAITQALEK